MIRKLREYAMKLGRFVSLGLIGLHAGTLLLFGFAAYGMAAPDPTRVVGPNACAECHKQEAEAWKGTHHFKTFRDMPRNPEGNAIAERMGLRRIKSEGICQGCHFTAQQKDGKNELVAGISCESCHSAGADWLKVHSGFSGKTAKTESKSEETARWKLAYEKGMIRPRSLYRLAKNCYGCHVVAQEDLVNKGGHLAGSNFELVSWSQGEVRHTTWYSKGKANAAASPERKRMLYVMGLGVELETALRAVGKATARKPYAFEMAQRADRARRQLSVAAKAVPNMPELAQIVAAAHSAALKLDNERALTEVAENIGKQLESMSSKYDGSSLAALDALMPGADKLKGKPREPGGTN